MSDDQRFEAQFEAAYGRYLEGAPVAVDAKAITRAITAASPRPGARRLLTVNNMLRLVLLAALVGTAILAVSLSTDQKVLPQSSCGAPLPIISTPGPSTTSHGDVAGRSPVKFLWSATGPVDDPMKFDTADQMDGAAEAGAIAVDRQCRVWVADTASGHDRFAIFAPDGTFEGYWGSSGKGDGQFILRNTYDGLGAVAFAPDGSFYVLDVGNLRIQHFAEDRTFLGSWGGPGSDPGTYMSPAAIAVDANGVVYVLDGGRDVVETYDGDGRVLDSFKPNASGGAAALAVDARGDVDVVVCWWSNGELRRFAPDGTLLATIAPFQPCHNPQMSAVAADAAGRVFTVMSGSDVSGDRVSVYDPNGALLASFGGDGSGDGQFGRGWIQGIALDGEGNVYLTDPGLQRLEKFRLLPPIAP